MAAFNDDNDADGDGDGDGAGGPGDNNVWDDANDVADAAGAGDGRKRGATVPVPPVRGNPLGESALPGGTGVAGDDPGGRIPDRFAAIPLLLVPLVDVCGDDCCALVDGLDDGNRDVSRLVAGGDVNGLVLPDDAFVPVDGVAGVRLIGLRVNRQLLVCWQHQRVWW